MERTNGNCHFCDVCDGHGCISELPGMGGVFGNANFIDNCAGWARYASGSEGLPLPPLRLAPITGAMQNVGWPDEESFYGELIRGSLSARIRLSIGDGYPDEKLKFGIKALRDESTKGAVFIKPYDNDRIRERMDWARDVAELYGVDIDAYAILTMRNLVNLERKTASQLIELKKAANAPFAIKGVFSVEDIELVREVRPDVVVVSNHGGRVETARGSTADFLARYAGELRRHAGELWVDGGLRTASDLRAARYLGADEVMVARPLITALLAGGKEAVSECAHRMTERALSPDPVSRNT